MVKELKTIWKETLLLRDEQVVQLPNDAEILCAREQGENVCIWFRCTGDAPRSPRYISIAGTGHDRTDIDGRYLGTAMLEGGRLVLHVFENTN